MVKKRARLFLKGIALLLILIVMKPSLASAEQSLYDNLYVAYPKSGETFAVDISNATDSDKDYLIAYSQHGRGNQLLGYQYRPEKAGYIIYAGKDPQKVLASEANSNKIKGYVQKDPINSYTKFEDNYIWDIEQVESGYFKIVNRKNDMCYTIDQPKSSKFITLEPYENKDSQKFKLDTMNGIYKIRTTSTDKSVKNKIWDIQGGTGADRNIIVYFDNDGKNQLWYIQYKPNDNAYVISNATNKNLILDVLVPQNSEMSSLRTVLNNISYDKNYVYNRLFYFKKTGEVDGNMKGNIYSNKKTKFPFAIEADEDGKAGNRVIALEEGSSRNEWIFEKIGNLPIPTLKNVTLKGKDSGEGSAHYKGETLTLTGSFEGDGFESFDLYSKLNAEEPKLLKEKIAIDQNGTKDFSATIDTSNQEEGSYYLEFFGRADSAYKTNPVVFKYDIVERERPTADPVPQTITQGTPLSSLNPSDFVKNMKDGYGGKVEAISIENLNTEILGEQTASVTIRNAYKTAKIEVPVTIVEAAKQKLTIHFQKDDKDKTEVHSAKTIEVKKNTTVNLIENPEIATIIRVVENEKDGKKDYALSNQKDLEKLSTGDKDTKDVYVIFSGFLRIASIPTDFNFQDGIVGKDRMQQILLNSDEDVVMSVYDSRGKGHGDFSIKAKLESDLYNINSSDMVIGGSSVKLYSDKEINSRDFSTIIDVKDNTDITQMNYDYTLGKASSEKLTDKIMLLIPRKSVKKEGTYAGMIVWQIENGP